MTECEFLEFCKAFYSFKECVVGGDPKVFCDKYPRMKALFNSPQFNKQYTTWKKCESIRDTAHKDGVAFGQQNPDPTQYAKREDLEKEIKREVCRPVPRAWENDKIIRILDIIRTHRKED